MVLHSAFSVFSAITLAPWVAEHDESCGHHTCMAPWRPSFGSGTSSRDVTNGDLGEKEYSGPHVNFSYSCIM